jgi:hypothetical protein
MSEAQAQGQATVETADTQVEAKPEAQVENQEAKIVTWDEHQSELTRVGTKQKKEGKAARDNELLEKTGAESIDDILAAYTAQQEISAELEGQEVSDLKKAHKAELKTLSQEFDSYKEALQGYLDKEREGLPEHITEVLDQMSAPDQLAYISKHGEALRAEARPATVGRGSSPGSGASSSASRAEVMPGLGRLKVAYETRSSNAP